MPTWKVQRLARVSSLTGEPFPPDTEIVTVLTGTDEVAGEDQVRGTGFLRQDFLVSEAPADVLEGAFCTWRTRTPPANPEEERRLDLGMAREFLQRLLREKDPERDAVCLTLALLLIRKRKLNLVSEADGCLEVRWPREKQTFPVPAPVVTEAEAEGLQQDLLRLFDVA